MGERARQQQGNQQREKAGPRHIVADGGEQGAIGGLLTEGVGGRRDFHAVPHPPLHRRENDRHERRGDDGAL
ncbi:MAG: hypothetical protein ACK5AK_13045 [Gemmatimonas sp.]